MASPQSSSPVSTTDNPGVSAAHQSTVAGNPFTESTPSRKTSSNADVLLPDSGDEFSDHVPLLASSAAGSTPYTFKYLKGKAGEDILDTPSHTDSSGDRSFPTPHSTSSTSMEIFLGPQPVPYIHRRQRVLADDFDRSPGNPASFPNYPAGVMSKGITIAPINQHQHAEEGDDKCHPAPLSRWRQEQMKKFKPSRPVSGSRERPIPLLHGPNSLPYARNPSGVDATVADQYSHMSHVFGMRSTESADGGSKHARLAVPGARIVSDPTDTRTTPGASGVEAPAQRSTSLSDHIRPVAVRDYNQVIGIKNSHLEVPADTANPRSKSHGDLRSQLGHGKPVMAAAGSPHKTDLPPVIDEAIHSASSAAWAGEDQLSHAFTSLALVDPVTNSVYNVRVPRSSSAGGLGGVSCEIIPLGTKINPPGAGSKADASKNWRSKSAGVLPYATLDETPVPAAPHPTPMAKTPSKQSLPADVLTVDSLYERFANKKNQGAGENAPPTSTGTTTEVPEQSTVSIKPQPQSKALGESTGRRVNVISTDKQPSSGKKKGRTASTHTKTRSASSPHPYQATTRAKGTPGAGVHLKRLPTDAEATPSKGKAGA